MSKEEGAHTKTDRESYGRLSGIIGIIINLTLFLGKAIVGWLSGRVSIVADALNNLSDIASSVVVLVGFKLSAKPADKEHPFGHARAEYIAATYVGGIIIFICFELIKSSVEKIINPTPTEFNFWVMGILIYSIVIKLFLYGFNMYYSIKINSAALRATAVDSLSDVLATSAILVSAIISRFTEIELDGYMGLLVAGFIFTSAIKILREAADYMLGRAPSSELTALIDGFIRKYPGVLGTHDLAVHEYGPDRIFASVHVEVDAEDTISQSHDLVDEIEHAILNELAIHLVVHLDPIIPSGGYIESLRAAAEKAAADVGVGLKVENVRAIKRVNENTLVFDVLAPENVGLSDGEITARLKDELKKEIGEMDTVIKVQRHK